MIWYAAYVAMVLALFVRFQDPEARRRAVPAPGPGEPLSLVAWHHRLVYATLVIAPLEGLVWTPRPVGRVAGLLCAAAGTALYRWAGATLGDALSPFLSPVPGTGVIRHGPYALVRHPMYLGQMLIVLGAPLLVGGRVALAVAAAAVMVIAWRLHREEAVLCASLTGYREYAASTKRLVPFLI